MTESEATQCPYCGAGCGQQSALHNHIKNHHPTLDGLLTITDVDFTHHSQARMGLPTSVLNRFRERIKNLDGGLYRDLHDGDWHLVRDGFNIAFTIEERTAVVKTCFQYITENRDRFTQERFKRFNETIETHRALVEDSDSERDTNTEGGTAGD